jgi:hypothetical protein
MFVYNQSINQSINLTSIAPISPAKPRLNGASAQISIQSHSRYSGPFINRATGVRQIYGGKAKPKRWVFKRFLKTAVELDERTDRGSLFHESGPQKRKALAPVFVLTFGTDNLIPWFDLSERTATDGTNISCK